MIETSTRENSYIVFSTNTPILSEFEVKQLEGCYKGTREVSFIANANDFIHLDRCAQFSGQESILVLGPANHANIRPATLHFLDGSLPEALGYMYPVTEEQALREDAWTRDGNQYYVARHNR